MSIFNFWKNTKSQETQSESSIRESAKRLVASGQISLDEARRAAEQLHAFSEQDMAQQKRGIELFRQLADRAGINRDGFKYDKFNLCAADGIFADEFRNLVIQFNAENYLTTMSKEKLTEKVDAITADLNKHVTELNRRFPSPTAADSKPTPAKFERRVKSEAEIDAECEAEWEEHLKQPNCFRRDLQRYASLREYQQHMRYRNQNGT